MYKKGIAFGVFDIFHIGHVRYLQDSANLCENLYVGVRADTLQTPGKNKTPYFSQDIRLEVVKSLKCIYEVFIFDILLDDTKYWMNWFLENEIDAIFIGEDWKGTKRWNTFEKNLHNTKIQIIYHKRTKNISSTNILNHKTS